MAPLSTAHTCSPEPLQDGTYLAVTVIDRGKHGITVWAGRLHPLAFDVEADEVSDRDYIERETVNFMAWSDVLEYFEDRPVLPLLVEVLGTTQRLGDATVSAPAIVSAEALSPRDDAPRSSPACSRSPSPTHSATARSTNSPAPRTGSRASSTR